MERHEKKIEKEDNEMKKVGEEGEEVDEVEMDRLMALEYHQKAQVLDLKQQLIFSLLRGGPN